MTRRTVMSHHIGATVSYLGGKLADGRDAHITRYDLNEQAVGFDERGNRYEVWRSIVVVAGNGKAFCIDRIYQPGPYLLELEAASLEAAGVVVEPVPTYDILAAG